MNNPHPAFICKISIAFELEHGKTNKMPSALSEESDQPVYLPCLTSLRCGCPASPVSDLEVPLEVNLNFQVWLMIILACGIFSTSKWLRKFNVEM